jgi:hypothetical protein
MRFRKPKKAVTGRYNGRQNTSIIPGMGVYIYIYIYTYIHTYIYTGSSLVLSIKYVGVNAVKSKRSTFIGMYVYVCVCMYACMYVCVYGSGYAYAYRSKRGEE